MVVVRPLLENIMENTKPSQIQISSRVVRMVEIRMLKPYAQNPRVHSIKQIEKIKKSIQQFAQRV